MAWVYRYRSGGRKVLLAIIAFSVASCGGGPPPDLGPPADLIVNAHIEASTDLNPDPWDRASPVVLRIYYLQEASAFQQAEFFPLYDQETDVLGPALIASEELIIQPGEHREYKATIAPETQYIAAMAAFRDIEHARWRALMELSEETKVLLVEEEYP
ncbi:MAG: type VI secretion system lipoprotein TssJ, partial [Gammaproteobacteria bacterium]